MLIGHYSTALVAKIAKPQLPLWQLFLAAQLIDIFWVGLTWIQLEYFELDFGLASNPLVLIHQPYTHSLLAALLWGLATVLMCQYVFKLGKFAAWILGTVVATHWLLDFFVHRPDLPLWANIKVGLALWNYEQLAMGL